MAQNPEDTSQQSELNAFDQFEANQRLTFDMSISGQAPAFHLSRVVKTLQGLGLTVDVHQIHVPSKEPDEATENVSGFITKEQFRQYTSEQGTDDNNRTAGKAWNMLLDRYLTDEYVREGDVPYGYPGRTKLRFFPERVKPVKSYEVADYTVLDMESLRQHLEDIDVETIALGSLSKAIRRVHFTASRYNPTAKTVTFWRKVYERYSASENLL